MPPEPDPPSPPPSIGPEGGPATPDAPPPALDGAAPAEPVAPAHEGYIHADYSHAGLADVDAWDGWLPAPPRSTALPFLRGLRELLDIAVLALGIFLLVQLAVANYEVDGRSMEPTFHHGDRLIVNRLAYRLGEPQQGDVVVLHGGGQRDLLKRVVALEGQRVEIAGGRLIVDGVTQEEPYIAEPPSDFPAVEVPADHVWVLGDNRNNSMDSRSFGAVRVDDLVGRAVLRYLPLGDWWFVEQYRQR